MKTKQYIRQDMIRNSLANTPQITFEVTDACNLSCVYCGYGQLYSNHDERLNKKLEFTKAKLFLDYLSVLWNSPLNKSVNNIIQVSFYGGEPLLNVPFIEKVIDYSKRLKGLPRKFAYSMTTNGVLLDKYMDFLVSNDFSLLISLDGDEFNNSYRVNKSGQNSYSHVIGNIDKLKLQHPEYFNKKVNFNAVLHNRNSVSEIFDFFKKRFDKVPSIGALNDTRNGNRKQSFYLLDAGISYTWKRLRFTLDYNNILNTTNYVYAYYGTLSSYYSEYRIRPASLLLSARFKIF